MPGKSPEYSVSTSGTANTHYFGWKYYFECSRDESVFD
jgi:hypothetical protein